MELSTEGPPTINSGPNGGFEIVATFGAEGVASQCDERGVEIVFTAPASPGRHEASLIYQIGAGVMVKNLSGTTVNN